MHNELCQAIDNRRIVSFLYKSGHRTVEPHMVAYNKTGKLILSAWFLRRGSDSSDGPGWRTYVLDEISQLTISNQTFDGPRPNYRPDGGKSFDRIQCAL